MADIRIKRRHELGLEEARQAAEAIANNLKERLKADYHWEGDTLRFARTGASGHIRVSEDELEVYVKLGLIFSAMTGTVERKIQEFLLEKLGPVRD